MPALNPYFLLQDGECTGVWNDRILAEMHRLRPHVNFPGLNDSWGQLVCDKDGEAPHMRITSLKFSNYRSLAARITIQ